MPSFVKSQPCLVRETFTAGFAVNQIVSFMHLLMRFQIIHCRQPFPTLVTLVGGFMMRAFVRFQMMFRQKSLCTYITVEPLLPALVMYRALVLQQHMILPETFTTLIAVIFPLPCVD